MAHKLDTEATYTTFDQEELSFGIGHYPEQLLISWREAAKIKLPANYSKIKNIVLLGMGGSHLGMDLIKSAAFASCKAPIEVVSDYALPAYVSSETLLILSSYSGTTEEVLAAAKLAKASKAKILVITVGGGLLKAATENKWPVYKMEPGDLAKQPRLSSGFSVGSLMNILSRLKLIKFGAKDLERMVVAMVDVINTCDLEVVAKENPAKMVADQLVNKPVLLVSAEHLVGATHVLQNQMNESAKTYCRQLSLPEINHHLFEGLTMPLGFFAQFTVVMFRSKHYNKRTQKRFDVTADVFEDQGATVIDYWAKGEDVWSEAGEVLQFANYLSYYLAMLHEVRPDLIPFVDSFKKKLN